MPNDQSHDPRVATAGERVAQAVGLSVAAVEAFNGWVEGQAPTIQSVSGAFQQGQTALINVSNLSTKRNGQLHFIDFESETVGQTVTGIQHADLDPSFQKYIGENASPLFGTRYARCHAIQTRPDQAGIVLSAEQNEIFMEAWLRYQTPDFTDPNDAQIKFFRMVPGSSISENAQGRTPTLDVTYEDGDGYKVRSDPETSGAVSSTWYGDSRPPVTVWAPWTYYCDLGDLNAANGKRYVKTGATEYWEFSSNLPGHFASPSNSVARNAWDGEEITINNGTLEGLWRRVLVPYYTRSAQETILDLDRIFINDSPERVVVGDASTFLACTDTKRFILKQNTRSNGQIEIEIDSLGPLATGPVYLYVFNRDGLCNESGYLWRAS